MFPRNNFIDTNPTMLGNAGMPARSTSFDPSRKIVVSDNGDAMAVWLESKGPGDTGPWNAMAANMMLCRLVADPCRHYGRQSLGRQLLASNSSAMGMEITSP